MTRDRARKQAIRARMATSDEPYSVAARRLAGAEPDPSQPDPSQPDPSEPDPREPDPSQPDSTGPDVAAVTACVARTLAAPSARVISRLDLELPGTTEADRRRARGLRGLARRGLGNFFNLFMHQTREGFAEPAAQRYLVAQRAHAELFAGGRLYRGRPGRLLTTLTPDRPGDGEDVAGNVLWPLWALSGATAASLDGTDTVGDSLCRRYVVQADLDRAAAGGNAGSGDWPVCFVKDPLPPHPPTFTVWTDGQYVRRVRFANKAGNDVSADLDGYGRLIHLELWDFGVPVAHLDWSRLPDFTASSSPEP